MTPMTFDFERYRPHVEHLDLSDADKLALVALVHDAMGKIVASEFDRAARAKSCGQDDRDDTDLAAGALQSQPKPLNEIYNEAAT